MYIDMKPGFKNCVVLCVCLCGVVYMLCLCGVVCMCMLMWCVYVMFMWCCVYVYVSVWAVTVDAAKYKNGRKLE